ncbi:MAG: peptide chain release factor N(5)-glutamine methyltransferase [Spirochaetales bacterium]|uniref:Release factor glutamine methyltransferase n=1 Tax=Candidatus Thalassospirochaeta sargassi TaxID=3119039 RepID=A0AAJ1IA29_9SPIO|nr:peptide chain release factor N(5)-glutamine methyltransferase [Spirochaetales bacterium]
MTYREALSAAADKLKNSDVMFCDTPMLDAQVLLSHASGMSREKLFASYPDKLEEAVYRDFSRMIDKRMSGFPVSYIRNIKEFYGRDFYVDESVLVPRPDTELIIDKAVELLDSEASASANRDKPCRVLDLCTGSGCIAVTMKLERPELDVRASDISTEALNTARKNAKALTADVNFIESNLFDNIEDSFDIIVTNPPYLTGEESEKMIKAGWPEPMLALYGGDDGLDLIRIIIKSSLDYLDNNSYLLIEAGPHQAEPITVMLEQAGFVDIGITVDMAGRNRVTSGRKSGSHNK